jgi:outer membrane receptor for ferrienterochelin and colicins
MNAFHWMDVSVTQKFWKNRWSLTVGGRNLFDVRNIQTSGGGGIHSSGGPVPMGWGRSFFTSLKMSF